jgi:hypothetical protein
MQREGVRARGSASVQTACGRLIKVTRVAVGQPGHGIAWVALAVGPERDGASAVWAGLSPREARELGRQLIEQADAREGEEQLREHPQQA